MPDFKFINENLPDFFAILNLFENLKLKLISDQLPRSFSSISLEENLTSNTSKKPNIDAHPEKGTNFCACLIYIVFLF